MKFAFIATQREQYRVGRLCAVLEVSRSGYYAWVDRPRSARAHADDGLQVQIGAIHRTSRGCYGAPRVHAELQQQGVRCGRKRVARVMRHSGLRGCAPRQRRVCTTNARHGYPVAPNLVAQDFTAAAPNRVWVADITYIATGEGWLYLAAVVDLYARGVVGWAMAATMTQQLTLDALQMALGRRRPQPGWVHHSDRGSQYSGRRLPATVGGAARVRQHEPDGQLLRQRGDGEFLSYAQNRARVSRALRHARAGPAQRVRLHRGLLQPAAPAFDVGLCDPSGV